MELFEEIRREYEFGIGTITGVAKKLRVHRRMVREAIGSALPAAQEDGTATLEVSRRRGVRGRDLESDRKAPRKQRHTAHRIWERMRAEMPECSVLRTNGSAVRPASAKTALGLVVSEVFVPQSYDWGVEAQVDWYEAVADLAGNGRSCRCSRCGVWPAARRFTARILHATQQAFLEAHELAFALLRRGVSQAALRQPKAAGKEDPARSAPGGDGAVHRVPVALALRQRVLHASRRA